MPFILLGMFLAALQIIGILTGGNWPKYSTLDGFANVMIMAITAYGFSFLLGYAGLASLGTAGFVGFGAYFMAFFLRNVMPDVPYLLILAGALLASLLLGLVVGFISLRIEGIFLAIMTLGISEVFYQLFNSWMEGTGGPNGARIDFYPVFQTLFGMGSDVARMAWYFVLVAVNLLLMMLTFNLGKSRTGRAMLSMKNSSSAAQAMGISILNNRLLAFLISTLYAMLAGALMLSYKRSVQPTNFTIMLTLEILAVVLIGGSRNLMGTFFGSFIVFGATPILLQQIKFLNDNTWLIRVIIGIVIILVVMFYPGGLDQLFRTLKRSSKKQGKAPEAPPLEPAPGSQQNLKQLRIARRIALAKELHRPLPTVDAPSQTDSLPEDVCLRLDKLSMHFGGLKAVDQLSFDVKKGEIFGLIGPNGAGKTTVFNCITQFYKSTGGMILFRTWDDKILRLSDYPVHDIITKGIVRTFQNVELAGELSVLDNLLVAAHRQYRSSLFAQVLNTRVVREEEARIRARALKVLEYCDLLPVKDVVPVGQPYGVLKRIELARTLMAGASLIILDEPAAGLNDQETVELTELIRDIQRDFGATIFLVEHDMGLVMSLCDHICAISFGKKLAYGTPAEIQNDPVVQEAYLGTSDQKELEVMA